MYRLIGPKLILFIPIIVLGILVVAFIPSHFGASRMLSFTALLLGEAGLSFIPILALYPKATPIQAGLLAIIYFFITFIICFAAFGINSFGWPGNYAFALKDGEFVINTYALFTANIFSALALISNFKLLYDEELTKSFINKQKTGYKIRPKLFAGEKPLLKQPAIDRSDKETSKIKNDSLQEEILKPFEFQPETENINFESLPEESSGKLYSPKAKKQDKTSDFFIGDEVQEPLTFKDTLTPAGHDEPPSAQETKQTYASPFPPSDIKDDLQAIFEQYSSLNAIKKLTSIKSEKQTLLQKKKPAEKTVLEIPRIESKDKPKSSKTEEEIVDATYRQITEEEKLAEIKEELKKQLKEELEAKLHEQISKEEEPPQKLQENITQSIEALRDELKKELKEKLQAKLTTETKKKEEATQKPQESREDIIRSLKKELIESLKEELVELKSETIVPEEKVQKEEETKPKLTQTELDKMTGILTALNNTVKCKSSMFIDYSGNMLTRNAADQRVIQEDTCKTISNLFGTINKNMASTNQGKLLHVLLESEEGTLAIAETENKILIMSTTGTGETSSGQILRAISEIEEIKQ